MGSVTVSISIDQVIFQAGSLLSLPTCYFINSHIKMLNQSFIQIVQWIFIEDGWLAGILWTLDAANQQLIPRFFEHINTLVMNPIFYTRIDQKVWLWDCFGQLFLNDFDKSVSDALLWKDTMSIIFGGGYSFITVEIHHPNWNILHLSMWTTTNRWFRWVK